MVVKCKRITITLAKRWKLIIDEFGRRNKSGFVADCIEFWYKNNKTELDRVTNKMKSKAVEHFKVGKEIEILKERKEKLKKELMEGKNG